MAYIPTSDTEWTRNQIEQYRALHPTYKQFAETVQRILHSAASRVTYDTIVQARAKVIASFAEKIQRKRDKYTDPVHQFTDLCGARVITHTAKSLILQNPDGMCFYFCES